MPDDPIFQRPEFEQGQANGYVSGNERFLVTNAITALVIQARQDSPPGSPSVGDTYIVGDTPSGDWSTFTTDSLAIRGEGEWLEVPARGGMAGERLDVDGYVSTYSETESAWVFGADYWGTAAQQIAGRFPGDHPRFAQSFEDMGLANTGAAQTAHGITGLDVDEFMQIDAVAYDGTRTVALPWTNGTDVLEVRVDGTNIELVSNFDASSWNARVRLIYTT